jgi:hypothetical protein
MSKFLPSTGKRAKSGPYGSGSSGGCGGVILAIIVAAVASGIAFPFLGPNCLIIGILVFFVGLKEFK